MKFFSLKKKRACYRGYVGKGNLGDEVLLKAIQSIFNDTFKFTVTDSYAKIPGILHDKGFFEALFLGGGTLVKPGSDLIPLQQSLSENPQTKFIVYGTGIGDAEMWKNFGREINKTGWRDILEQSAYLAVRGPLSKQHLESWGVTQPIRVIGDPALFFGRPTYQQKVGKKNIGVNLGPAAGFVFGKNENAILTFGSQLIKQLDNEGWHITFFPVIHTDVDYLQEAVRLAGIKNYSFHYKYLNINRTLDEMAKQDVFIGEKLHSVIMSHCTYTPSIMLAYRTKCIDYMTSMNSNDFVFKTDSLDIEQIMSSINTLTKDSNQIQIDLFNQIQQWKSIQADCAIEVKSLFNTIG